MNAALNRPLRAIPAVDKVLQSLGPVDLPRPMVVAVVRRELASLRRQWQVGTARGLRAVPGGAPGTSARREWVSPPRTAVRRAGSAPSSDFESVVSQIRAALDQLVRSRLQPVINATGVIIHTNLGRSPLGREVVEMLGTLAAHYTNLEFDLIRGERGGRAAYLEQNLALLCGAEAATAVNNCAAALVLILRHFTADRRKEVIISRGELVQIGGGFRIPEILESSGARLREVGTTNKTALSDYARAAGPGTALILKVHRSNFFMGGFVESPATEEIAALARKKRIPFVEDLGSGAVVDTADFGVDGHEPTPAEVLERGVGLVCFSGDKLLGGPQAGIIAGKAKLVAALKREPFFRALRCGKLILGALQTTVDLYLAARSSNSAKDADDRPEARRASFTVDGDEPAPAGREVRAPFSTPVLAMLHASPAELHGRAERIVAALARLPVQATIGTGKAQVGGGTLPQASLQSVTVDLVPPEMTLAEFGARLRAGSPPVIGYVGGGKLKLDLRSVFPSQDELLIAVVRRAMLRHSCGTR